MAYSYGKRYRFYSEPKRETYIDKLIKTKHEGELIRLIVKNKYLWSDDKYMDVFSSCRISRLHKVVVFMLEHTNKIDKNILLSDSMSRNVGCINPVSRRYEKIEHKVNGFLSYLSDVNSFNLYKYVIVHKHQPYYKNLSFKANNGHLIQNAITHASHDIVKYILSHNILRAFPHIHIPVNSKFNFEDEYYINSIMMKYRFSDQIANLYPKKSTKFYEYSLSYDILHQYKLFANDERYRKNDDKYRKRHIDNDDKYRKNLEYIASDHCTLRYPELYSQEAFDIINSK